MKWQDLRNSDQVEDRRNQNSGGGLFGGSSNAYSSGRSNNLLLGILMALPGRFKFIAIVGLFLFGFLGNLNLGSMLNPSILENQSRSSAQVTKSSQASDEVVDMFSKMLGSTEDFWREEFARNGMTYRNPKMVIYTAGTSTQGCGYGSAQAGPFYCPADETIYIDLQFYNDLTTRYKAPGDFAIAYVIAHEVGHHVQKLDGTMESYTRARNRSNEKDGNALTVRLELQADYYAGAWAKYVNDKGLLDAGDIQEALQAAHAVGDDTLQKQYQGYVVPDSFTHGTSKQRQTWFSRGVQYGDMKNGDAFRANID